jgi:2-methylisocitrate lyase-like PEP mutase family enzyme
MSMPSRLKKLLQQPGVHLTPSSTDALTARLIAEAGFEIAYMGGNATTASRLGVPDVGLLTMTEMADNAARIADASGLPLIVDADTGYGNALNVRRTVRAFERAGAAGLHIEDQTSPKKCGHFAGKQLIGASEMIGKINAALDARDDADFLIIARTDAIAVEGFDAAFDRLSAYREAGADMVMFGPPCHAEDLAKAAKLDTPIACVLDTSGNTPLQPAATLEAFGVKIGILPTAVPMAVISGVRKLLADIRQTGSLENNSLDLASFEDYNNVLGLAEIKSLETRYKT